MIKSRDEMVFVAKSKETYSDIINYIVKESGDLAKGDQKLYSFMWGPTEVLKRRDHSSITTIKRSKDYSGKERTTLKQSGTPICTNYKTLMEWFDGGLVEDNEKPSYADSKEITVRVSKTDNYEETRKKEQRKDRREIIAFLDKLSETDITYGFTVDKVKDTLDVPDKDMTCDASVPRYRIQRNMRNGIDYFTVIMDIEILQDGHFCYEDAIKVNSIEADVCGGNSHVPTERLLDYFKELDVLNRKGFGMISDNVESVDDRGNITYTKEYLENHPELQETE